MKVLSQFETEDKHHQVNVIRITEVLPHANADRLEIIRTLGYQTVVAKGQFRPGDLAYFVPPDSVVPEAKEFEFLWAPNRYEGGVPERKRRIAAKKLRGEWSEGLLMPVPTSLSGAPAIYRPLGPNGIEMRAVKEGDEVAEFLGIYHYNPPEPGEPPRTRSSGQKVYPRTLRGWWAFLKGWLAGERRTKGPKLPVYDVKAYKHFAAPFQPGETVLITEKIHGCNARFSFEENILGKGKFYVGSRSLWKSPESSCVWREAARQNPGIEAWCRRYPGYALYGEVVSEKTQKGYAYGCLAGQVKFFVFDVRKPDGFWAELDDLNRLLACDVLPSDAVQRVPTLYTGTFDEQLIKSLVDGPSTVPGARNIREGIVIRSVPERQAPGIGRLQLKIVSNDFLAKETSEPKEKKAA